MKKILSLLLALAVILVLLASCASDEPATIADAKASTFEFAAENGEIFTLPYRVYYPSGYKAEGDAKYPILLFLHGHGECGTDNTLQLQVLELPNKFLDDLVAMDNCIILAPQTTCDAATDYSEWIASGTGEEGKHQWTA